MARISTYPFATPPSEDDYVIGTDAVNANVTKNFLISDILALGQSGGLFVPYSGAVNDVDLGSYNLTSNFIFAQTAAASSIVTDTFQTSQGASFLGATAPLQMNGSAGTSGYILKSNGAGSTPSWVSVGSAIDSQLYHGSFYDSITQTITTPQLATGIPVILRTTDSACTNGVSIVSDGTNLTRITFANTGVYNLLFSAQLTSSSGTSQTVDFWLRKNGSTAAANIADTNGKVSLQGNANFLMAAWNYFIPITAGDYIQLMWTATSNVISIVAEAANAVHPATPSIIVTVNQV
jgi:hypothetical protein